MRGASERFLGTVLFPKVLLFVLFCNFLPNFVSYLYVMTPWIIYLLGDMLPAFISQKQSCYPHG